MKEIIPSRSLIELRSLTKSFKGKQVISQFNLKIKNGQFLAILGPSGCGKSTILRLIAGLEIADQGRIFLDGQDITTVPPSKRNVNIVFQNYALFPHMSVFENIAFGLKIKKQSSSVVSEKVENILEIMQIQKLKNRYPNKLSGGQQQRVAIARAMINQPKALLLDESLSALDYSLKKKMQKELKRLQRQSGITFIYVTHNQEEAFSMSDRILIMKEGRLEQYASPEEIYKNPKNLFVAKFVGEINILDATVVYRIEEKKARVNCEGLYYDISTKFPTYQGQKLKILLRPEDLKIKKIKKIKFENKQLIGFIRERIYKGMIVDTEIEIKNGKRIKVSEISSQLKGERNYLLNQKIEIKWKENSEIIFFDES
ncbi:spermidine/putrescine ABC transporter ATP-binding protein PotA [Candidatus Riesia pediculicola]|uniref:Spermidine/putrescine import ATP-binding protein PotA n=1 Tax=Riesia pediculicola (strain USDA) TaxID=515618 RepID=D4G8S2_RIEPU|nr:spermidine/putrescine ABC transporter ATP-binding protein PotA [Candidatus Riesia pediculicola]ADD79565.1 spermidine/putrescine import ATP-binding protein PotA [Candidatus Riesia pediculicola USDA]QOJ86570.1 spermidine/putrescine ABC transporter ATP-binding protein PotA [Candidatus Riesia pediculicola]